jgi:hypothetical protein
MVIKVQSISDLITNSSTEVFVVYDSTNINSIKRIVDSILAIDSSYTFDDLFTIKMIVSERSIDKMYREWDNYFPGKTKPDSEEDFINYLDSLSDSELDTVEDIWANNDRSTYYWEYNLFYEGYQVNIKEGVEKSDKLQKAVDAIRSLDSIFSIDYSCE